MKIPTTIGVVISALLLSIFAVPSNYKHEKQVKSLAFSYGIYSHQGVCPNSKKIDLIADEYKRHYNLTQKDKEWIDGNFKRVFDVECLKYQVERSEDGL